MNPPELIRKIRLWGIRGVINHFRHRNDHRDTIRFLTENAKIRCSRECGITIIGNLSARLSVSKTLRDFAFSLRDAGIPFQTFDLGPGEIPEEDIGPILTPREDFRINRYSHVIEMLSSPLPDGIVKHRGRIMFWEFEHGLLDTYPIFIERPGDVIGMSDFNVQIFEKELQGKRPVRKILYPLRVDTGSALSKDAARQRFGFSPEDFIVFYNFSLDSGYYRKNPLGALKAFAMAFRSTPNAKLVFKINHVKGHETRMQEFIDFAAQNGFSERLVLISDYLSHTDLFSLTNTCDIYLSLHRSEGFGLGIAEAMSLGKTVVVTDYSGVKEFCNTDNSILVPAKLTRIKPHEFEHPWYRTGKEWADPNITAAATALRELYTSRRKMEMLGKNAQDFISRHFSTENFRESVLAYLTGN